MTQIACRHCDLLVKTIDIAPGEHAICPRCQQTLYLGTRDFEASIALLITALLMYFPAILLPFLTMETAGKTNEVSLLTSIIEIARGELWLLAITVFILVLLFPLVRIIGLLLILLPLSRQRLPWGGLTLTRYLLDSAPWNMIEVYLIGVLVAIVKLVSIASINFSAGFFAFVLLILLNAVISMRLPNQRIWQSIAQLREKKQATAITANKYSSALSAPTALQVGYITCLHCGSLLPQHSTTCPLCHASIHARKPDSLSKTTAYLLTAIILFFPANLLPTMFTQSLLGEKEDTILSGILYLWNHGDKPIALIVFVASFITPLFKMGSIAYLCYTCYRRSDKHIVFRTKLYHINELIGRWSMIDVFVVALLSALVQMGSLATIEPRIGIVAFALVVFFSMRALQQFDPRLIWNNCPQTQQPKQQITS